MASEILLSLSQSPRQGPPLFYFLCFLSQWWSATLATGFRSLAQVLHLVERILLLLNTSRSFGLHLDPEGKAGGFSPLSPALRMVQKFLLTYCYGCYLVSLNKLLQNSGSNRHPFFFFFLTCRDVVIQEFGQGSAEGFFSIWHLVRSLGVFKWCVDQSGVFRTVAVMARRLSVAGILVLSMNMRSRWSQHRLLI